MTPCRAVQQRGFHCFDGGFWVMLPLLATCLWTVFLPGHVNSIDESVLQEIRTLGAQAWKRNENTLHNFSCRGTETELDAAGKPVSSTVFSIDDDMDQRRRLIIGYAKDGVTEETRIGLNERYYFIIGRTVPGSRWALRKGSPVPVGLSDGDLMKVMNDNANLFVQGGRYIHATPLSEFFTDEKNFRLLGCAKGRDGLVLCDFECRHSLLPAFENRKLHFELDPRQDWLLVSFTKTSGRGHVTTMRYEYQAAPNRNLVPKIISSERGSRSNKDSYMWEFGSMQPATRPDEEFYLPHYGISESAVFANEPTVNWVWWSFLIMGVLSLCVGLSMKFGRSK